MLLLVSLVDCGEPQGVIHPPFVFMATLSSSQSDVQYYLLYSTQFEVT
jgi:hypothetical protein